MVAVLHMPYRAIPSSGRQATHGANMHRTSDAVGLGQEMSSVGAEIPVGRPARDRGDLASKFVFLHEETVTVGRCDILLMMIPQVEFNVSAFARLGEVHMARRIPRASPGHSGI